MHDVIIEQPLIQNLKKFSFPKLMCQALMNQLQKTAKLTINQTFLKKITALFT